MSTLRDQNPEQDALLEYSSRFIYYYRHNKAVVWGTGIAVVLVIGAIIGYFVLKQQNEGEAQLLLGQAEEYHRNGDYEAALFGDDETFTPGFVQIADNYGRTRAGNLAVYYAAVVYLELGQPEEAREYMERFEVPAGILGVGPITFHGVILAELGEYEAAAQKFAEAADWNENNRTTPWNLLEAAVAWEEAGQPRQALEQLDRLLEGYPDSPQFADAQRMKGRIMADS